MVENQKLKIGIVCYPTYGGSGVIATELGKGLAKNGHEVHFITYKQPFRLDGFHPNVNYHEVSFENYDLFKYPPYHHAGKHNGEEDHFLSCTHNKANQHPGE